MSAGRGNDQPHAAGTATAQTTADASGNYSFAGLANGTYTVTPVKAGVIFTPEPGSHAQRRQHDREFYRRRSNLEHLRSGHACNARRGNDGCPERGRDSASNGRWLGNLQFCGAGKRDIYDNAVEGGHHLATPATQTVTLSGASANASFTAVARTWNISGHGRRTAATVTLSGTAAASTTTDAAGNYSSAALLTAPMSSPRSRSGYTFSPRPRS